MINWHNKYHVNKCAMSSDGLHLASFPTYPPVSFDWTCLVTDSPISTYSIWVHLKFSLFRQEYCGALRSWEDILFSPMLREPQSFQPRGSTHDGSKQWGNARKMRHLLSSSRLQEMKMYLARLYPNISIPIPDKTNDLEIVVIWTDYSSASCFYGCLKTPASPKVLLKGVAFLFIFNGENCGDTDRAAPQLSGDFSSDQVLHVVHVR